MKTSTVVRAIFFTMVLALGLTADMHAQTVQLGISAAGQNIIVSVKSTVAYPSNYLASCEFTIRWLTSYNVSLGAVTTDYFISKTGQLSSGLFSYNKFSMIGLPAAINWPANTEVTLLSIPVAQTGAGAGAFELAPADFPGGLAPFIMIDFVDQTNYTLPFYKSITDVPLPVELTDFSVTMDKLGATLAWKTATEVNTAGFDIERTLSGPDVKQDWTKVGYVAGAGTSNVPKEYLFRNKNVQAGSYAFRLKQIDRDGGFTYSQVLEAVIAPPREFSLAQNYPNPFNPSTTIEYAIAEDSRLSVKLYDIVGREVLTLLDGDVTAGYYALPVNARDLSSGVYFYRIVAKHGSSVFTQTKRLMLMK